MATMNLAPAPFTDSSRDKLLTLLASEAYRSGEFTLSSGGKSNHYVNCKPVSLSGSGLVMLSQALFQEIDSDTEAVAGLTLGADPLVSGVALVATLLDRPLNALIVRKEPKGHGTDSWLEGPLPAKGSVISVLEDVVTTGGSSLKAVHQLRENGYLVKRVIAIVDRQEGGEMAMKKLGLELKSLFLLKDVASRARELAL